ncbi:MAG: cytochrome c biogenesis protein CcsA [Desulfovibrionaceae bacterium]|nr:cytochrome c biogenesis protein CcsA [Desulfovibrionaceae bacterium]MDD4951865.1 cytochrome c biogenesis protein CcsA [Desulfovibrionaceae bacterium]
MGSFELLQISIIGLYLLGTILFLGGAAGQKPGLKTAAGACAGLGFGLHTLDLILVLAVFKMLALGGGDFYFSLLSWTLILVYLVLWWRLKLQFLALTALPLALLAFVSSMAAGGIKVLMPQTMTMLFFGLHASTLTLALALLTMAFGAGVIFLRLNRKIKTKSGLKGLDKESPPLSRFDSLNHWAVMLGFPLYTLGVVSGFVWTWLNPKKTFSWDPMNVISTAAWFLFAFLYHQRIVMGWKGRKPALVAMAVFLLVILSFIHHTITFKP